LEEKRVMIYEVFKFPELEKYTKKKKKKKELLEELARKLESCSNSNKTAFTSLIEDKLASENNSTSSAKHKWVSCN